LIWRRWSGVWDAAQTSTAPSCPFARARGRDGSAWTWRSIGEWTFADNVVQAGRRLLRRGRQPPRLRRPLPRRRVDRRRRHGASTRGRGRPTSASRSRAGIAGRMIQARSPAGRSAHPGLAAALPSTREAREPTRYENRQRPPKGRVRTADTGRCSGTKAERGVRCVSLS
jgi:hypothetical protein